jgi:tetratricopeptide (TPR) repeat protein
MYMLRRNLPAALLAFDRAIEINPSYPASYARKGRALILMQQYEEALVSIRYALRINGATTMPVWHLWAGMAQLELGRDEEARASVQVALGAFPNSAHVLATLAALHAMRGEWTDADRQVFALRRNTVQLSDRERLSRLNTGADGKPLANRLGQGLRLALQRLPELR